MPRTILFFTLLIVLSCCNTQKENNFQGVALGTYYSVTYMGEKNGHLHSEIDSLLRDFSKVFSIFDTASVISKMNRNENVEPGQDVINVFQIAQQVSAATDGAFDITVGVLVNAWGFGNEKGKIPGQHVIDSLKTLVGYEKVSLQGGRIVKSDPGIRLNFNAIAKGYAVDKVAEYLQNKGYRDFVVDIGGEVSAKGSKRGKDWKIGIQIPTETKEDDIMSAYTFVLKNRAVATSGNYRNYHEENGKRYAHTINPKTGYTEQKNLLSVTVIADNCCLADAYATAFMVMGLEKSLSFLEAHPGLAGYFVYDENGEYRTKKSAGFP